MPSPSGGSRQQGKRPRVIPFGKYLLLERIAIGGMAEVYMAKSFGIEGFEKLLAIKRILPTMAEDDDFIEMFVDEAKISGQLNHANIAPIFELGKIGESHYIAMEYVWGKDLLQIMNRFRRLRKKMPPAMVAWVASKMCEALDYAHHKRDRRGQPLNIIHRDVSPQNVLVSYEGEVKVIDFGIAKAASRTTKTQAGVLKGKFGYMSPEQVRGLPIDPRSDIFAVGTCMYEMLTSDRLFMGESDFSTLEKVRNADVRPIQSVVRDIPPQLAQIVMQALQREPADRPQSGAELQELLMKFLATQRPPFGTSKLGAWMKTAFATEMAREKARLDGFASIGRPSVLGGPRRPRAADAAGNTLPGHGGRHEAPAPQPQRAPAAPGLAVPPDELSASDFDLIDEDGIEGEATVMSASPFDEEAMDVEEYAQITDDELNAQPTQIFFSAEEAEEAARSAPLGSMPGPAPGYAQQPQYPAHQQAQQHPPFAQPSAQQGQKPIPTFKPGQSEPAPAFSQQQQQQQQQQPAFTAPPGGYQPGTPSGIQIDPSLASPQRSKETIEVQASQVPALMAAQQQKPSTGKMVLLFLVASVVMLGVGVGAAYVLLGGGSSGTIEIRTVPPVAATITIDGEPRGSAPLRVDNVATGDHIIEFEASGFESTERRVHVEGGATAMLEVALVRSPAATSDVGAVAQAETTNAEGEEAEGEEGATANEAEEEEDPAEEEESASAEEEAPREAAMTREEPREERPHMAAATEESTTPRMVAARVNMQTQMASPMDDGDSAFGTLVINSLPWARVFIDGNDTQRNTPVRSLRVRAGTRRVGLRTPDEQMHEFRVEVGPGETVRISKRL